MKRTRVPGTKALLHASHPPECPKCGADMVTVNWKPVCMHCEKVPVLVGVEITPDGPVPQVDLVPSTSLYPNRAARRRARL